MLPAESQLARARAGFTLVELLTVIAIIAVLASLLLTAVASARKKSRTVTCTSHLQQFTLALDLFLDDSGGKRPAMTDLLTDNYLPSPESLICPEDQTGDWGQLIAQHGLVAVSSITALAPVKYSYLLDPLTWNDAEWKSLVNAGSRAGVAACQLHGLGNQNNPNMLNYSGLLLRAQLDGSVIRRQFFWTPLAVGYVIPEGLGEPQDNPLFPLEIYFDDPANWQAMQ